MPVFKFTDHRGYESMLRGTFLLSSLDYFAYLDIVWKSKGIGDRHEAATTITMAEDVIIRGGEPIPKFLGKLIASEGPQNANIILSGITQSTPEPHALIMSLTEGEFETLKGYFSQAGISYGCAFEVIDPVGLARALWEKGRLRSNRLLQEFVTLDHEPRLVSYGRRARDIRETVALISGPFTKDEAFRDQNEFRIQFQAKNRFLADRILVTIEQPERFIRPLPSWGPPIPDAASDVREKASLAAAIETLSAQVVGDISQPQHVLLAEESVRLVWEARLHHGLRFFRNTPYRPGQLTSRGSLDALAITLRGGACVGEVPVPVDEFSPL